MIENNEKFISGVKKLSEVVGSTLGPKGQLVVYRHLDGVRMTKDGVTAAKFVESDDKIEQMGIEFARAVADKVVVEAGDGTTTATVLTYALIREAQNLINAGKHPKDIVTLYEKFHAHIEDELRGLKEDINPDKIQDIASISANDEDLAELIIQAVNAAGQDGLVDVVDGYGKDRVEHVDGINWKSGYFSEYMVTDDSDMTANYRNPRVILYNGDIVHPSQAKVFLEISINNRVPVVVVCNDLKGEASAMTIYNVAQRGAQVVVIKAPGVGKVRDDFYQDLGVMLGAHVFKHQVSEFHTTQIIDDQIGSCEKIKVTKNKTVIVNPRGNEIDIIKRVKSLRQMYQTAQTDYDRELFQERIGRLANKVVLFHCGGSTQAEIQEKKDRIEDCLKAIREALRSGYLPGGGSGLFIATKNSRSKWTNSSDLINSVGEAFERALQEPMRRIAENAGYTSDVILDQAKSKNGRKNLYVWNAMTNKFETLDSTTIIDPASVTFLALKVAIDTASMIIRTSKILAPEQDYQQTLSNYAM